MKYESMSRTDLELINKVKREHFPELTNANMKYVFTTKASKSGGRYVLAKIKRADDVIRYLTLEEYEAGLDYMVFFDKLLWDNMVDIDKERLIRHELRHAVVDLDDDNPYKLRGHTIEDFYEEVELNRDDIRWSDRLGGLLEELYSQQRDRS